MEIRAISWGKDLFRLQDVLWWFKGWNCHTENVSGVSGRAVRLQKGLCWEDCKHYHLSNLKSGEAKLPVCTINNSSSRTRTRWGSPVSRFWDAIRLTYPADCGNSLPRCASTGSVQLCAVTSHCHYLGEVIQNCWGNKMLLWLGLNISSQLDPLGRDKSHTFLFQKWDEFAERWSGYFCLGHIVARVLDWFTPSITAGACEKSSEKSDSLSFLAICLGNTTDYYSAVRMKLWLHFFMQVLLVCGQLPQLTSRNPLAGLRHIYAPNKSICLKDCGV